MHKKTTENNDKGVFPVMSNLKTKSTIYPSCIFYWIEDIQYDNII